MNKLVSKQYNFQQEKQKQSLPYGELTVYKCLLWKITIFNSYNVPPQWCLLVYKAHLFTSSL